MRLGRFGTLVNDPVLGRRILTDAARFRTVGPGTHGELMDLAIGPDALLNMDGPAHEALRRALGPLFAPAASAELVASADDGLVADAGRRLAAGEEVDLVRLSRILTGRTTFALLGAPTPPDGDEGYLASYRLGEALVGMTVQAIRRGVAAPASSTRRGRSSSGWARPAGSAGRPAAGRSAGSARSASTGRPRGPSSS